jgi:hypothetical protein
MAEESSTVLIRNRRCVLVKFPDGSSMRIGQSKRVDKAFLNDVKIKQLLSKKYLVVVPDEPVLPVNVVAKKEREVSEALAVELRKPAITPVVEIFPKVISAADIQEPEVHIGTIEVNEPERPWAEDNKDPEFSESVHMPQVEPAVLLPMGPPNEPETVIDMGSPREDDLDTDDETEVNENEPPKKRRGRKPKIQ